VRVSSSTMPRAGFLAQIGPDLRDVAAERFARHDLRRARARQLDIDDAFNLARAVRHHQDAVGKLHRLGDVVGDEQRRLLQLLLDLQHLIAEQKPRLLVERANGSSISRIFGSDASVRAIDTRWRMPPESSAG